MADTLREKLQALVGELHQQASIYRRGQELRDERQALVYTQVARKIAAILAESEESKPKGPTLACPDCKRPLPGSEAGGYDRPKDWDRCPHCKTSFSFLKPEPNPGQTHYVGDDCPGGHAEVGEMLPVAKR